MVKDSQEAASVRKAVRIASGVLDRLQPYGRSEQELANMIEMAFLRKGVRKAFDSIVAAGPHAGTIHHTPTTRTVTKKDFVITDAGCTFNHYCCDMTRTRPPAGSKEKLAEDMQAIQHELADVVVPGVAFSEVQKVYERLMERGGYPVMHAFGHGIGLNVHERPRGKDLNCQTRG